jgi:hypothetical protein
MDNDNIFQSWLESNHADARSLAASSDRLMLLPDPASPPRNYIARFDCQTMAQENGEVKPWNGTCDVLFRFPLDYLRVAPDAGMIVSLLAPLNLYHPNIAGRFICIGRIAPGTSLCDLIFQVYEVLTFARLTPREDDALNRDACAWARRNMQRFPLDARPLRRQAAAFDVSLIAAGASDEA